MKKLIIIPILLFFIGISNSAFSQSNNDTSKYVYCELVGNAKFLSTKVTVTVDYGEEKGWFQDTRMKDEQTGRIASFNSMVDALNYMASKGWDFQQAYIITTNGVNVYHWLLKKKKWA